MLAVALIILLTPALAVAQTPAETPEPALDPVELIGMDLGAVLAGLGVPVSVYAVRGEAAWQDDVVFRYADGLEVFWYQDRVWQVRLGQTYPYEFRGLRMGDTRRKVVEVLGTAFAEGEGWLLYHYAGAGFPIRVRVFVADSGLDDLYIYRGDF